MLKIENLKKYFGGVKAVNDCSFEIKEKTITALIGPNGAGKSTVFNIISGIMKADSGKVVFDGKEITNLSPEKISNLGTSRLFQQSRLFNNLTVRENLLLALDSEDTKFWSAFVKTSTFALRASADKSAGKEERIKEMLELVGLEEFKNKLSRDLSYGQKRLVELLRAILNPHIFLMLDEPAAGINPQLRKVIAEILLKLKSQGETILLIEHDMNFAFGVSDEVIVMDGGRVIAEGTPEEIKSNPEVLEAYLGE